MFGLLRPKWEELTHEERARYSSIYCNLCGQLSRIYGFRSRALLVNDVVTLQWLLCAPEDNSFVSLRVGNCIRGGVRKLKSKCPTTLERLLTSLSVYLVGIKLRDDRADEPRWTSRVIERFYRGRFELAERELADIQFPTCDLQNLLSQQHEIESKKEADFTVAATPTARAYGLVARQIAAQTQTALSESEAGALGEELGRAIYLIDAVRDYQQDLGNQYNPLCESVLQRKCPNRSQVVEQAMGYVIDGMRCGQKRLSQFGSQLYRSWVTIEKSLMDATGISDKRYVTLYASLYCPCGNGAVVRVDDRDCHKCCDQILCYCCLCLMCNNGCRCGR